MSIIGAPELIRPSSLGLYKVNPDAKGFSALNALYLARLSALVYSEAGVVKQKVCDELGYTDFYWFGASGSNQGFVAAQESIMVIIFRGTDAADDWWTNLNALRLTTPHGEIHKGFHDALEELWIDEAGPDPVTATGPLKGGMLETIKALQAGKNERPVFLGGHSLGGALASVAAARLALEVPEVNVSEVGTIGCPRVFDNNYAAVYDDVLEDKTFRVVNNNDGVPRGSPGLHHVGTLVYIDSSGNVADMTFLAALSGFWKAFWSRRFGDALRDHDKELYVAALAKIAAKEAEELKDAPKA